METEISLKSCILLICGLPSSGKSWLTNNLLIHSQTNPFLTNCYDKSDEQFIFYKISIDELIPINQQSIAIQINGFWKQFRNHLLMASKIFINQLINKTKRNNSNEINENVLSIYESIKRCNNYREKSGHNFVLIIDDNFYYKSMRYEWFQIAKHFQMGFALVMINCPLDLALNRNQRRDDDKCVPNSVIIKMNQRFQSPQFNGFEMRTFNVSADCLHSTITQDLIHFIIDAIRNPVVEQKNPIDSEMREQSKCLTQLNVIHRVDCVLRELINERIVNSLNKIKVAKVLNEAKKSLLIDLKQSVDILPADLRTDIVKTEDILFDKNEIKVFLNQLLNEKMNANKN